MFKMNGISLKAPPIFDEKDKKITRGGRTASGKLNMDVIAIKKEISIGWSVITNNDFEIVLSIIKEDQLVEIEYDGYVGNFFIDNISYKKLIGGVNKLWVDFRFDAIEQ